MKHYQYVFCRVIPSDGYAAHSAKLKGIMPPLPLSLTFAENVKIPHQKSLPDLFPPRFLCPVTVSV